MRLPVSFPSLIVLLCILVPSANGQLAYQMPPEPLAQLVDAPAAPSVSLSPSGDLMLWMYPPRLAAIADLAEPEVRLGRHAHQSKNQRAESFIRIFADKLQGTG